MDTSKPEIDITAIKNRIEQMPYPEQGWELVYDGPVRKDYPGNYFPLTLYSYF